MTRQPVALTGVEPLADAYDGFIVDVWGVLHDGLRLYPGVAETLDRLAERGKAVVFLTNAPRRSRDVARVLARLELPELHRRNILSSGESVHAALADRADPFHAGLGRRCLILGDTVGNDILAGLDFARAETFEDADFIVNIGPWRADAAIYDYEEDLARAAGLGLPMICANPDLSVMQGGREMLCAGALAAHYEALGGSVAYHGKPHPAIYDTCLTRLGEPARDRVVAIGDSLGTDIKGAAASGIASALALGGLHAGEAACDALAELYEEHGAMPTYTLPGFAW
ncbi:MAG: TIGR01459 family HAD-type hydrolase [Defluviicoccus sp.]|nr:TIGR01459 family HAD-type hydrolase [Defluviicoccus sp.]MDE0385897.1 TIGR01459 family HAD-type hydrolase [Defluviicoccus sp.]